MRLPGKKHAAPCILGEISRSPLSALFPQSEILQKIHQELESVVKQNLVFNHFHQNTKIHVIITIIIIIIIIIISCS